jgi:ABC-type uncharacterized transport system substrate-binding protein
VNWEFDRVFSADVISMFDKNKDGNFDAKEKKEIYSGAFISLRDYGYFIFLRKGASRSNPASVSEFNAWQEKGILHYSFFIPFDNVKFGRDIYITVFDRSYYCATGYTKEPVHVSGISERNVSYSVETNKKYPVYYDPMGAPGDRTIYRKWKPGLETAYPDEIHLTVKE